MGRKRKGNPVHGWLIIDKDLGISSNQVVGRVRRILNAQKVGHAGTLDPLATGVLPIACGEATKTIPFAQDSRKKYRFTVTWGESRSTDDCEGEVTETSDKRPTQQEIKNILPEFIGDIEQTPPKFSAIKIDGERAYKLARAGEDVKMKSRIISVYDFQLISSSDSDATFEVECGKGTYVRALGRDMAIKLSTFGYISKLRRLSVGSFDEKCAISLDELEKMVQSAQPEDVVLPVETALDDIPDLAMTDNEVNRLIHGQSVRLLSRQDVERLTQAGITPQKGVTHIALARTSKKPIALVEIEGIEVKPVRVLNL